MKTAIILATAISSLLSACSSGPYVPESKQVHWTRAMIAEQHREIAAAGRYEQAHPTPAPTGHTEYVDPEAMEAIDKEIERENIDQIRADLDQLVWDQE